MTVTNPCRPSWRCSRTARSRRPRRRAGRKSSKTGWPSPSSMPIGAILDAAVEHRAHAIGMSGLLVKSTVVMRENLEEMSRQGLDLPVMLGGAALTRRYVEEDCVKSYACGRVAYARDAFAGLDLMDRIVGNDFDGHLAELRQKNIGRPVNQSRKLGRAADPRPMRPVDFDEIRLPRAEL